MTSDDRPRAPGWMRWLWCVTVVVGVVAVAWGGYGVELMSRPVEEEPEGLTFLAGLVAAVLALAALVPLLVAVGLRRRSAAVVAPLLATSAGFAAIVVVPLSVSLLVGLFAGPHVPSYDEQAAPLPGARVFTWAPGEGRLVAAERPYPDLSSERDRVDAAVNTLILGPPPGARQSFWTSPCSRTYTGTVSLEVETVEVVLLGGPRSDLPRCRLTPREETIRGQQLAWTVAANLDGPGRTIRVRDVEDIDWTVLVPDARFR